MILIDESKPEWWYLAGLIATDGCLLRNGRRVTLVAKSRDFLEMVRRRCSIEARILRHANGRGQLSHCIHICGRDYWNSLAAIGLTPAKSKTIPALAVPRAVFFDFLRGVIDGDGCIRRWIHPRNGGEQWSLRIYSASPHFLAWLGRSIEESLSARGKVHISVRGAHVLKFGKLAAQRVLKACYDGEVPALERKKLLAAACVAASSGWSRSKTVGQVAKLANAADS